jgi:2',3'-cyclic-nucleotide 2'-phosphodiesterase (5'-nucleotidase family)
MSDTVKVTVLAPKDQHVAIWQLKIASTPGDKMGISRFYVLAAQEKLERIRSKVRRASR